MGMFVTTPKKLNLQRLMPRLASLGLGDVQYIYEAETEYNE